MNDGFDEQPGGMGLTESGVESETETPSTHERLENLRMETGEAPKYAQADPNYDPLDEAYRRAQESGEKTDYPSPEPPKPGESDEGEKPSQPIDIGEDKGPNIKELEKRFPNLKQLIEALNTIEKEEFADKYEQRQSQVGYDEDIDWDKVFTSGHWGNFLKSFLPFTDNVIWQKISNPEVYIVHHIATITKEFLLFKAICQNWDEKTLLEQYRLVMRQLWNECAQNRKWYEGMGDSISTAWLEIWSDEPKSLPGENPSLEKKLTLSGKPYTLKKGIPQIMERLKKVESQFKGKEAGLIWKDEAFCTQWSSGSNECETWNETADFDEGILEFIHGRGMLFLREYTIYRGIIDGLYLSDFDKSYREKLAKLYKSALKE